MKHTATVVTLTPKLSPNPNKLVPKVKPPHPMNQESNQIAPKWDVILKTMMHPFTIPQKPPTLSLNKWLNLIPLKDNKISIMMIHYPSIILSINLKQGKQASKQQT